MAENLARASRILLFGRVVEDVQINASRGSGSSAKRAAKSTSLEPQGVDHALADQIAAEGSCLARVYAFSYEGGYYELARPALYLVQGAGDEVLSTIETTGVAATPDKFATDLRVWAADKADFSVRLDVETGTLEQILLDAELNPETRAHYSGQAARLQYSGQAARLQYSGQAARLRGGRGSGGD